MTSSGCFAGTDADVGGCMMDAEVELTTWLDLLAHHCSL